MNKTLEGKIAVVAGGTRGAGRAIALALGEQGATVYVAGRSTRGNPSPMQRPETIEETAEEVTARGGQGIPVRADLTVPEDAEALFARVKREQGGRLDILINDIWGGDMLMDWGKPFWQQSLSQGLQMQKQAVSAHLISAYYAAPLLASGDKGLLIEITDGVGYKFRGNLFYSLAKISAVHIAEGLAEELKPHGVTALSLTPGFLRSEAMLDHFGVTEANWRDAAAQDPHFIASETPAYIGRAVAALAADPNVARKNGLSLSTWALSEEYDFTDADGSRPHWGRYFAATFPGQDGQA
ncbi:SDR family oxidoreductase [Paenibacillus sp. YN15]|uniref:SDR family oxidoreductase n=1 Tax=Paenibacillus sp. YN15 TaxID=1742774 RepID=UPI000DCCEFAB|nr:SDR family oxidoreductase [Paenibacillus sp. YN15]RAV01792.1 short-chain dehydrogenase [Paenibacillus sp. YN15]